MSAAPTLQSFIAGRWLGQHGAQALRSALDGLRGLLAEVRAGRQVGRYDRGSLRLALRELEQHLADEAAPSQESETAA